VQTAWRLTKTRYLATAWDGEGARRSGGRWNSVGIAVVYTSATLSLTLLETLVHITSSVLPAYTAIPIDFEDSLVEVLATAALPADWRSDPAPGSTRAIGDAWYLAARSPVLKVPSVVVPGESNYVLNPRHPGFAQVHIGAPMPFPFVPSLPMPQPPRETDLKSAVR